MTRNSTVLNRLIRKATSSHAPPPKLLVSGWADEFRRLSPEASSEPGRWKTSRAPYQRGILDAANDPSVEEVVIMSSAQVGKTELILNTLGYFIDYDPAPILVLQPTLQMAEAFSKDRLAPMVRDTPALHGKIKDARSRDSGNTLLHKSFPGGHVTLAGANSPASLASRPIRILLADEVDRYPVSAGTEGDPLGLAGARCKTFWNRKKIYTSTPTIKGHSRIETLYENSTQEQYHLPCPACGFKQPLTWGQIDFERVGHACSECGVISEQHDWLKQKGVWVARKEHSSIRGFHINELYSPWSNWESIVVAFKEAKKNPETLKTFVNTVLGETWEDQGEGLDEVGIMARREEYPADVPDGPLVLTAGVDVQQDRFEMEVVGWAEGDESWSVDYRVIRGDTTKAETWGMLDDALKNTYTDQHGNRFTIAASCIDSGYNTSFVYDFCKPRRSRRVFAVKGVAGAGKPIVSAPSRKRSGREQRKVDLFTLGVDGIKDVLFSFLQVSEEGAGYCHFPTDRGEEYFKQLTAEKRVTKFRRGFPYQEYKQTRPRNEALDCRNYAYAALKILNPVWPALAKRAVREEEKKSDQPAKRTAKQRRGFVNSWRK